MFDGASTRLRDQFVALQTTCWLKRNVKFMSTLVLALVMIHSRIPASQSSALTMAIKNLLLHFMSFS